MTQWNSLERVKKDVFRGRFMFWRSEDVMPAVKSAEKLFGSQNQYLEDTPFKNVSIMSREFGKLWFGDIEFTDEFKQKMEMLSVTINQKLYLTLDYEHDIAMYETTSKLRETQG